jgi:hypothetical protein
LIDEISFHKKTYCNVTLQYEEILKVLEEKTKIRDKLKQECDNIRLTELLPPAQSWPDFGKILSGDLFTANGEITQ